MNYMTELLSVNGKKVKGKSMGNICLYGKEQDST